MSTHRPPRRQHRLKSIFAYHEAGHAVVAKLERLPVKYVSIRSYRGRGGRVECDIFKRGVTVPRAARVAVAGFLAELIFRGERIDFEESWEAFGGDGWDIAELARRRRRGWGRVFDRAVLDVELPLLWAWPSVVAVATELAKRHFLSAARLDAILRDRALEEHQTAWQRECDRVVDDYLWARKWAIKASWLPAPFQRILGAMDVWDRQAAADERARLA